MPRVTLTTCQEPALQPTARESVARGMRILLVEDEPLTAEVFTRALLRDGHLVDVARDGLQAMRQLRDRLPNLVILDMMLPAIPGADVVRKLREGGHLDLPIIVVSGSPRRQTDLSDRELSPGTWLEKPVKPRRLVQVVRAFTRQDA
ncbi:MAG TPA: response regulator [Planctomycetota bacterium]|nr:response regulator [Planctomycetota bacterium]